MFHTALKAFLKCSALALCLNAPAFADIDVNFEESAPRDSFTITNLGPCSLPNSVLVIDIGTSPAGLIFDTTSSGVGVQVFQPFTLTQGADLLSFTPIVGDGDQRIIFHIDKFDSGDIIAFTTDIDDTGGGREITVSGSEITGAQVRLTTPSSTSEGLFGPNARATVENMACTA